MNEQMKAAIEALTKIARWIGEFPDTKRTWGDGTPMSYGAAFGSNGERDYMRQLAINALAALQDETAPSVALDGLHVSAKARLQLATAKQEAEQEFCTPNGEGTCSCRKFGADPTNCDRFVEVQAEREAEPQNK